MKDNKQSNLSSLLNTNFNDENTIWLTSSFTLRKTIGILGMLVPFLLWFFLYIDTGLKEPLESISHYYYTRVSGIFVSIMSILAIFLIVYKGKEPKDLIISLIAGIAILFVVFFPTGNISTECCVNLCSCSTTTKAVEVSILPQNKFRETFHYGAAGVFLVCLSYMSIFLFTQTNKPKGMLGEMKKIRNLIYVICGVIMLMALAVIFFGGFLEWIPSNIYNGYHLTFWMETLAVESFGFSWFIKGETLFKDNVQQATH